MALIGTIQLECSRCNSNLEWFTLPDSDSISLLVHPCERCHESATSDSQAQGEGERVEVTD